MIQDLSPAIENDIDLVSQEFEKLEVIKSLGGEGFYFRTPFITNPSANNEDYKYGQSIRLGTEILNYYDRSDRNNVKYLSIIWTKCSFSVEYDKSSKYPEDDKNIKNIVKWVVENVLNKLSIKPFKDEDAYLGYFSFEKNEACGELIFSFYVNPDYPDGWWENHAL